MALVILRCCWVLLLLNAAGFCNATVRIACLSANCLPTWSNRLSRSSEINSIVEIASRNDLILMQGIQEKWLNYIRSTLKGYSFISYETNQTVRTEAYLFRTGKVSLLNHLGSESNGPASSSVLVNDLKGDLPAFVLTSFYSKYAEESDEGRVTAPLNINPPGVLGADMIITITPVCSAIPSANTPNETQLTKEGVIRKESLKTCTYYRTSASDSFLKKASITQLQTQSAVDRSSCSYRYSSAEFLVSLAKNPNTIAERASNELARDQTEVGSSAAGIAAAKAVGASLGAIIIFCTILCVICCCINHRCSYHRIP